MKVLKEVKKKPVSAFAHLISQMHVNKISGIYLPTGEVVMEHPQLSFLTQADYAAFNIFEIEGDEICLVKGEEYNYENLSKMCTCGRI